MFSEYVNMHNVIINKYNERLTHFIGQSTNGQAATNKKTQMYN